MKRLTLIRHAKSDWTDPDCGDFDRPLNNRGKKAAPLMGRRLAEKDLVPQQLLSSPAKRARKTSLLLAREFSLVKQEITFDDRLYEASLLTLIELLRELPDVAYVALVAHNPGLSELGGWLCPAAPEWLPTCAALTLDLPVVSWGQVSCGCATLFDYDYPKKVS